MSRDLYLATDNQVKVGCIHLKLSKVLKSRVLYLSIDLSPSDQFKYRYLAKDIELKVTCIDLKLSTVLKSQVLYLSTDLSPSD